MEFILSAIASLSLTYIASKLEKIEDKLDKLENKIILLEAHIGDSQIHKERV